MAGHPGVRTDRRDGQSSLVEERGRRKESLESTHGGSPWCEDRQT